tara:strand:- start:1005 stop:1391 length:387 start_codon:yes stop_codon:yes gene_type:complete
MTFLNHLKSALKGENKICDPLLIYIILGIFKFFILYMIYCELSKEGFAPINTNTNTNTNSNNSNNNSNNLNNNKIDKFHLIMVMNFMFYLYIIFGMFLHLLCKNNMKGSAWFIILYPFISKLVWSMII